MSNGTQAWLRASGADSLATVLADSPRARKVAVFAHTVLYRVDADLDDSKSMDNSVSLDDSEPSLAPRFVAITDTAASRSANAVRLATDDFARFDAPEELIVDWPERSIGRIRLSRTWRAHVPSLRLSDQLVDSARAAFEAAGIVAVSEYANPAALIGFGQGLTPAGDDMLCGYLAAAHAFDDRPVIESVRSQAIPRLTYTTDLSADFIRHAIRGDVSGELRDVLLSLGSPHLPRSIAGLLAVGQTSGADLATGLLHYLNTLPAHLDEGVLTHG